MNLEESQNNVWEKPKVWIFNIWKAIENKKKINPKYRQNLGKVSERTKEAIKIFYGKNVSKQIIKPENLLHIYNRHGRYPKTEIENEQIPITADIAARIPDVLANPDYIKKGGLTKKNNYETVIISKKYADGSFHIVNAILKNNVLEVHTAYVWNKEKTEKRRMAHGSRISETGSNNAIPPQ